MISLQKRQCDFTLAFSKLVTKAICLGYEVKVAEWNRLLVTQKDYVARGVSWTLDSRHLDNLAVDMYLFKDGVIALGGPLYRPLGEYWESLGGRWGGRFGLKPDEYSVEIGKDPVHFEFTKPT